MIRNSKQPTVNTNALRLAPSSLQEDIHLFLEGRHISDIYVSQQIRSLESFNPNDKIYVSSRLGPVPSGYLIFRPDSPAIYWNTRTGSAHIVRIQFDKRKLERVGSVVFSATFYGNEGKMVLEDVLYCNGFLVWHSKTFSERWSIMKDVCRNILRPDVMQNFELSIVSLQSLESWLKTHDYNSVFMWEFIIDKPKTRRILWKPVLEKQMQSQNNMSRPAQINQIQQTHQSKEIQQTQHITTSLIAQIEKDTILNLPDSYILFAKDKKQIGSPALKKLTISLALRSAFMSATFCKVRVEFNETFKKYEVVEVVDNNEEISQYSAFDKKT